MSVFPLSDPYRDHLAEQLYEFGGGVDPLHFVQERVFRSYPEHARRLPLLQGKPPIVFYRDLVRYCELSAWSEVPPLLISLLRSFEPISSYQDDIARINGEGPFQCHPYGQPYWVCRVAEELPLLGRLMTRSAAIQFDKSTEQDGNEGKRVLRVFGPEASGKTYTLAFFRYLAAIQPLQLGVADVDFGDSEMALQAASAQIPIELFVARRLEAQVRRRRAELRAAAPPATVLPDLTAMAYANQPPHLFLPLTESQQRNRWAKELASELVDQVIYRVAPLPRWWIVAFDNCEKAPAEAQEFVRRLVERAAGTDPRSAEEADKGQLRVVLLGDSTPMLPSPVYANHLLADDLNQQVLGSEEIKQYFKAFGLCRGIELADARIQVLVDESLARAQRLAAPGTEPPVPWPRALAKAVLEKTLPLESLAAKKR